MCRLLGGDALVALLGDGEAHALAARQRDVGLGALADDEHVVQARGEGVARHVAHVHDVEGAGVALARHDGAHSPQVTPARDHAQVAGLELDEVHDLGGVDVELDGVVDLDERVRVAQRAPVVRHQVRHVLGPRAHVAHLAQLVLLQTNDFINFMCNY